jgi:hypothetical protein
MKHWTPAVLVLVVIGYLFFVTEATACSCIRPKACAYAGQSGAVFIGEVLDSVDSTRMANYGESKHEEVIQTSTVRVYEAFTGIGEAKEVKIVTDVSSSCMFRLGKGVTYIFYASGSIKDGTLGTGYCSGTKPVEGAEPEIEDLRRNQGQRTTVSGSVQIEGYKGLAGKPPYNYGVKTIRLVGANSVAETGIDERGNYTFTGVPAGEYTFDLPLPRLFKIKNSLNGRSPPGEEEPIRLKVSGIGCAWQTFSLLQNGKLAGMVTDAEGRPVGGITIYVVPLGPDGKPDKYFGDYGSCYDYGQCQQSAEDGRYFFDGLEAGNYRMGVRLGKYICNNCIDAKFQREFYPGVEKADSAKPVSVSLGATTENINFRLSKTYTEREIHGTVTFTDGRPAPRVWVRFVARTPDRLDNHITFLKTDETGNFTIKGYESHDYLIGAYTDERDDNPKLAAPAVEVRIVPRRDIKPVKLVLAPQDQECIKCGDFSDFQKQPAKKVR